MSRGAHDHIGVLDGLRFVAALSVAAAHYAGWLLSDEARSSYPAQLLASFTGLGMTLFFVLSGFVIHYNYRTTVTRDDGIKVFAVARFSRLYPLYIALFAIEFIIVISTNRGSCSEASAKIGAFVALPLYLTLTQDWFYGVICKNSIIYQFSSMSAVTWSISAEVFFYAIYVVWMRRYPVKNSLNLLWIAIAGYALAFLFVWLCAENSILIERAALGAFGPIATEANGYQDSLIRWLYYFNPAVQFAHFIGGMAAAQTYLASRHSTDASGPSSVGTWLVTGATISVVAVHLYLYGVVAFYDGFVGRNASLFYGPLVVALVLVAVQFRTTWLSRSFSWRPLTLLGEASYSLYLLHAFCAPLFRRLPVPNKGWMFWLFCLIAITVASRLSYSSFERPARSFLRQWLSRPIRTSSG